MQVSWLTRLLHFTFSSFVIVLISALLVEVALRIYNPISVPLRANKIVLPVNNHFITENTNNEKLDREIEFHYNSLGFRGPEPPEALEAGYSIVTVGGSTTACVGLTDGKTWPDVLYKMLQEVFPSIWLNNAGMDGHSTFGHLQLLHQFLGEFQPDMIIYLVGVNEVGRDDLNKFDARLDLENLTFRNRLVASSELLSTLQVVSRNFRAIRLGANHHPDIDFVSHDRIETPDNTAMELLHQHATEFAPTYEQRLRSLIRSTREFGIHPVLVTQPAVYGDDTDPTLGIELGTLHYIDNIDSKTQWKILEIYNDITRVVARELNVDMIDLAVALERDTRYYYDWVHYTNEGAAAVAEILFPKIRSLVETGPGRNAL